MRRVSPATTSDDGPSTPWQDVPRRDATWPEWVTWASRYNGYELLADHPAHLARVLAPAVEEYRATGEVPTWAGVHLLRGWLFLMVRADRHAGGGMLDEESQTRTTWFAVTERLRALLPSGDADGGPR